MPRMRRRWLALVTCTMLSSCTPDSSTAAAPAASLPSPDTLAPLTGRRIFFGHQSVGANLVAGAQTLAAQLSLPLRFAEALEPGALDAPGFVHGPLGQNERPLTKLAHFEQVMGAGMGARADVAFFKFCYIDLADEAAADDLFERYRATLARLQAAHPRTTFVHVTVPLTTLQRGPRALVKRLLGRPVWGERENAARHRFNERMRAAYAGREPLFDLARLESERPDGTRETYALGAQQVPALVPAYSDDGQHLNAAGQRRLAAALLTFLAALPARGGG